MDRAGSAASCSTCTLDEEIQSYNENGLALDTKLTINVSISHVKERER